MSEHSPARLETYLRPTLVTLELPVDPEVIDQAYAELANYAVHEPNGCFGYFPFVRGQPVTPHNLPASQRFANAVPDIEVDGMTSEFDFIRFSNRHQGTTGFRIDTEATIRPNGAGGILNDRLVKRTLFNMHSGAEQNITYMDVEPADVPLRALGLNLGLPDASEYADRQQDMVLPPRNGSVVYGCDLYTSHVLHADVDGQRGHFIARYGTEILLSF